MNKYHKPSQKDLDKLLVYYQNKEYIEAEYLANTITQNFPNHAFSWKVLGSIFKQSGRKQKALFANQKAVEINDLDPHSHNNLGNTLNELGRFDEAEKNYNKAIKLKPEFFEAHNNLGNVLKDLGKFEEAVRSYKKALELNPRFETAQYNLGTIMLEQHNFLEAIKYFKNCESQESKLKLLRTLYLLGDENLFYELLDDLLAQGENNTIIGSLINRSKIKFGKERKNPFCKDPLEYILETDLTKQYDFENIFVKSAIDILSNDLVPYRNQGYLTNGCQTAGNLFELEGIFSNELKNIIYSELEKYRIYFKDSKEGFIKNWPSNYYLYGWLISMNSGGELAPHMHDYGWVTCSIYINIPAKPKTDNGNLVLGIDDGEDLINKNKSTKKIINVTTGTLCIFPSSLLHYTIPFDSKEERIVLAFDVVPK